MPHLDNPPNTEADNKILSAFSPLLTHVSTQSTQADSLATAHQYPAAIAVYGGIMRGYQAIDSLMQIPEIGQLLAGKGITRTMIQQAWADRYGNLSGYQLYARQYPEAEQAARQGLALDSAQVWINDNLAHALVLQDRFQEAKIIFENLKDVQVEVELETNQGSIDFTDKPPTYRTVFLETLLALEKAGITHKDFARVRALLPE